MTIKHLVEIGRIGYVAYGRNAGKPVVIVDVIDQNRALIDGPCSKVKRQPIRFKRLRLTKLKLSLDHSAPTKVVEAQWTKNKISEEWKKCFQFQKLLADKRRKDLSDFGRFKVYRLKQQHNALVKQKVGQLKYAEVKKKRSGKKKASPQKK